jgi:hypothetical protein
MIHRNLDEAGGATVRWSSSTWRALLAGLTLLTFLVQGYHPYAEDGGMYLARVLAKLHPALFPQYNGFVQEPLRISLYSALIVALVHLHLPLDWVLLLLKLGELWLTLCAGRRILQRCRVSDAAQLAGVALLGAWSTMPVAATSLMLMDPYVTARSFSTPLTLLALAYALDDWRTQNAPNRSAMISCALCLLAAFAFHPLMAVYAAALILVLRLMRGSRNRAVWTLPLIAALLLAAAVQAAAPAEPPAVVAADLTRYYWFLSQWHWYEILGLIGPLAVLGWIMQAKRTGFNAAARDLCRAAIEFGVTGTIVALAFAHENYRTHLVARFQPLRVFCLVYALLPLLLGAAIAQFCGQAAKRARSLRIAILSMPVAIVLGSGIVMFLAQRSTFPDSPHLELPWCEATNQNPWVRAFVWIRSKTPQGALFAIDARYVNTSGEDAQVFRAIAQRSVLPDFSKDGGEASQMPWLAPAWQQASAAQQHLSDLTDDARDARLRPVAPTWMVLHASAITAHPCPYNNSVIKVCVLPR